MIQLSKIRLINWYGFSSDSAPIGLFTLIAGKNGNGKSVMLDAIKYALYGDTIFNKSTENKGSRTIVSYTRGLLDATEGSYMRPADKEPNVFTHIVLEMYERDLDRYFVLGTVIETNSTNGTTTQRYVIEEAKLGDIELTYESEDGIRILNASELQKRYGLKMLSATDGLTRFMQRTGLRFSEAQLIAFRRKLRSIMSYDPDAKIDSFIRESVLEEKKVDLSKLSEIKSNIDTLTGTIEKIDTEISELDGILNCFKTLRKAEETIFVDDVKIKYKDLLENESRLNEAERKKDIAERNIKDDEQQKDEINERKQKTSSEYYKAQNDLDQLDCTKAIRSAESALNEAEKEKRNYEAEKTRLGEFQERVNWLTERLDSECIPFSGRETLATLTTDDHSKAEKESCVDSFRRSLKSTSSNMHSDITRTDDAIKRNDEEQSKYQKIIDDCNDKITSFTEIPDYVILKNRINAEFSKRGIASEAHFACEYVIGIKDEAWRNVIEGYLGRRRYTVLVEPEYYDIADDVFNSGNQTDAHLFNTKLLMKKNITVTDNSVANLITIKNTVAKRYFDYLLGRFKAVDIDAVKEHENAMSKEGRISAGMDSSFIRQERINRYYLGQETIELNRKRAENKLNILISENQQLLDKLEKLQSLHSYIDTQLKFFGEYDYDAYKKYNEALKLCSKREAELEALKKAQKNNQEFVQLLERVSGLQKELEAINDEEKAVRDHLSECRSELIIQEGKYNEANKNIECINETLNKLKDKNFENFNNAISDYKRYLDAGNTGTGGILKDRGRAERGLNEAKRTLLSMQSAYNTKRSNENWLPADEDSIAAYQTRKDKIWMDDRQDILEKLNEQTRRYESIFKNEFVLTILKECETAKADLKLINSELARLSFKSSYEFDVDYVKDGSDYQKILEYAKYLKEREKLGCTEGQLIFDTVSSYSNDKGIELEDDIRKLIDRIVSGNNNEQIERFADYRNYMNYEILISNEVLHRAKLSKQSGYNSGAEVQIPYMLILLSALLMIYNDKSNSTRLVFIDEPFAKMDPSNVKIMMDFMKEQGLQMIFCAPDKTELIGNECQVILPVLRIRPDIMEIGIVEMH